MLLKDDTFKPGAAQVFTKQLFMGSFIIKQIVKGKPDIGEAYQLVDERTGKPIRNLVMNDRLKKFDVDRNEFNKKLPRSDAGNSAPVGPPENRPEEPVVMIHQRYGQTDGQTDDMQ